MDSTVEAGPWEEQTCLLLVHGTFASEAMWEKAPLVSAIKKAIPTIENVKALGWSGANTFRARFDASKIIIDALEGLGEHERAIVCAHSHGGSAVCYAMRNRPDLFYKVSSVLFLATPFYSARLLPSWRLILDGLFAPVTFLLFFCILALAVFLGLLLHSLYTPHYDPIFMIIPAVICGEVGLWSLHWANRIKSGWARRVIRRATRVARSISCQIPAGTNAYFVRQSGDEASAFLTGMQGLSWAMIAMNRAIARVSWFVGRPFRTRKLRHSWTRRLIFAILSFLYLITAFDTIFAYELYSMFIPELSWELIDRVFWPRRPPITEPLLVVSTFLTTMTRVALIILTFIPILFFVASAILLCLNWLLSLAFGALPLLVAGVLQPAVEETPPGTWTLHKATWTSFRRKVAYAKTMRHSSPYSDADLTTDIARWLSDGAREKAAPSIDRAVV